MRCFQSYGGGNIYKIYLHHVRVILTIQFQAQKINESSCKFLSDYFAAVVVVVKSEGFVNAVTSLLFSCCLHSSASMSFISRTYNGRDVIYTILILINGIKNMFCKARKGYAFLFFTWLASVNLHIEEQIKLQNVLSKKSRMLVICVSWLLFRILRADSRA